MLVCIPSPCFVKNKVPQLFAHSVSVLRVMGIQLETGMFEVDSNSGLGETWSLQLLTCGYRSEEL